MSNGAPRALLIPLAVCVFNLAAFTLFAQGEAFQEDAPAAGAAAETEEPGFDHLVLAEQAISLGDDADAGAPQPASALSILRVLATLAVVAAAIYGIIFVIKRLSRGGNAQDPYLKILASAPLGVNRRAYVISVGSQAWLVGTSENSVSLISEIGDKETLDAMLLDDSRRIAEDSAAGPGGRLPEFKTMLQRWGAGTASGAVSGPESIRKRRERLKGMGNEQ